MSKKEIFRIIIITVVLCLAAVYGYAIDYPHFGINNIGCNSCHFVYGSQPSLLPPWTAHTPQDIDDTQFNTLCWSCHNDIDALYVRTHSSLQIDNGYGDWTVECRVCHNPHYQQQFRTYGSASYLYSGTSTGLTATTITKTGAGWTVDAYQGLVVVPNVLQKSYNYKILSNTADTLTVQGPINLTKATTGNTFAIVYGKLINQTIDLSKITITPSKSGSKTVRFFRATGTKSFADGDATYDGVCEVCHTQTNYHDDIGSGVSHNDGIKCTNCHNHVKGFKGGDCISCHATVQAGTRRIVTGASGDFVETSHHVADGTTNEIVTVKACIVCHGDLIALNHPPSSPYDPRIELIDQDSGIISTYDISASSGDLEPFCVSCHDANGSLQNGAQPFNAATGGADTNSPVNIGWTVGSMSHSAPANADACMGCHGNSDAAGGTLAPVINAHGSGTSPLLSDIIAGEAVPNFEEGLCFACHDGSPASTNIEAMFAATETSSSRSNAKLNTHHDVSDADQAYSGAVIECTDCHNPHAASHSAKVIADPDPGDGRIPASGNTWAGSTFISEFCLDCHDNSYPASVTPPTTPLTNIREEWILSGGGDKADQHGPQYGSTQVSLRAGSGYSRGDILQCTDCHYDGHGDTYPNLFQLKSVIYSKDGATPLTPDWTIGGDPYLVRVTDSSAGNTNATTNGKAFCSTCHPNPMGGTKNAGCLTGSCHGHGASSF